MAQFGVSTQNPFDLLDESDHSQAAAAKSASSQQVTPQAKPAAPTTERSSHKNARGGNAAAATGSRAGSASAERGGRGRGSSRGRSSAPAVDSDASFSGGGGVDIESSRDHSRGGGNRRGRGRGFGDGSRREFDRRGAPRGRPLDAPRKQGLAYGSQLETYEQDPESGRPPRRFSKNAGAETETTEAKENGTPEGEEAAAPVEEVTEITEVVTEPVDSSLSYDDWAEQQKSKIPEEDLNQKPREVSIDEKQWKTVVPLNADAEVVEDDSSAVRGSQKTLRKKNVISLDEFVGSNPASNSGNEERGGRGRGALRGNFDGERGGRGDGRGRRGGSRGGAASGPRGGAAPGPRGGRGRGRGGNDSGVNVFDDSAFPALQQSK